MNAPIKTLSTGAGGVDLPPSVSPTRPVAVCSDGAHDVWGDVAALTLGGHLRSVHLEASAHKNPAQRVFRLRGETRRRTVTVTGLELEACAVRLVEMTEADAVLWRGEP